MQIQFFTRFVPEAQDNLEKVLMWSMIPPDEGPSQGGDYGPYVQSQRLHLYTDNAKRLVEVEKAYYCFCSEQRLNLLRREALRNRETPKYDNKCRHLSKAEVGKNLSSGLPFCIRFKLMNHIKCFSDLIHGSVSHNVASVEGDPVIIKTDGYPTYHFANVVDDHFMEISHVFRGWEWQTSTTKHLLMYDAFGWQPPKFGHLPLLLNKNGTKLSKRQDSLHVERMKEVGYFPEAVLNFISNMGGGFGKDSGTVFTVPELISKFDLTQVNTNSSKLDMNKLLLFNRKMLQKYLQDPQKKQYLCETTKKLVKEHYDNKISDSELQREMLSDKYISRVLEFASTRVNLLQDLFRENLQFIWVVPHNIHLSTLRNVKYNPTEVLASAIKTIEMTPREEFKREYLVPILKDCASKSRVDFSSLMLLMRLALSGLRSGPSVAEMLEILGKKNSQMRLRHVIELL